MANRLRSLLGPLGLVIASTLVALAIGELLVRLFFPPVQELLDERLAATGAYEAHPVLGWRPRPNITQNFRRFDATFRTNSRGLRGRELQIEKPPGLRRIVVLGDSFAWGYGVNDAEVFPQVLESRLERTEVVNLGVTAFGLSQELDYFKLEGMRYEPDIVILAFCQNDIHRDGRSLRDTYEAMRAPRSRKTPSESLGKAKAWLSEHLMLYRLTQQAINTHRSLVKALVALGLKEELEGFHSLDTNLMPALRIYPPELKQSFETTEAELLQMRNWLAERKIRFILALIPARQALEPQAFLHSIAYTKFEPTDFDLGKPYRNLEAFARVQGIEVINPYSALKHRADTGASLYLRNDVHFNVAGHKAFAEEIEAYLRKTR
jgi:lysophospholipase L1-like esterase